MFLFAFSKPVSPNGSRVSTSAVLGEFKALRFQRMRSSGLTLTGWCGVCEVASNWVVKSGKLWSEKANGTSARWVEMLQLSG